MTDLYYTIWETIHRRYGRTMEIVYEYSETRQEQIEENMQIKQEKRTRNYQASIKRHEYDRLASKIGYRRNVLPFDTFVVVLRPFMMGTYDNAEIHEAFRLLDKNSSNTIDLDELSAFLPVIHPNMTKETLLSYIDKVAHNDDQQIHSDQQINFDQFRQMVLRGIAREIVCGDF